MKNTYSCSKSKTAVMDCFASLTAKKPLAFINAVKDMLAMTDYRKNTYSDAKTAVIGIGNSILSDDGIGIKAVNALKSIYKAKQAKYNGLYNGSGNSTESENTGSCRSNVTEFIEVSSGGINLMEYMAGFQRAVVIDAIVTGRHKAGTVFKFIYPDIPYTRNTVSTHDMDLPAALEMGKYLGISLPSEIIVFAVEAKDTVNFGEILTEEVESALGSVVAEIKLMLDL